ncbi:hypothetical protein DVH24_018338 [Malus domestica]|uniref:Uncharacterized protein n=1 Tax=Malus domestica TaxID=3750 RepID=A0A498KG09_MALDO|nr:hypothetical protein DVH24_018338 [Malus domestica]
MLQLSSMSALQKWVSQTDLQKFGILVCVGNKVDRVPGHPIHAEYRRRLQKLGDLFADDGPGFTAYDGCIYSRWMPVCNRYENGV